MHGNSCYNDVSKFLHHAKLGIVQSHVLAHNIKTFSNRDWSCNTCLRYLEDKPLRAADVPTDKVRG